MALTHPRDTKTDAKPGAHFGPNRFRFPFHLITAACERPAGWRLEAGGYSRRKRRGREIGRMQHTKIGSGRGQQQPLIICPPAHCNTAPVPTVAATQFPYLASTSAIISPAPCPGQVAVANLQDQAASAATTTSSRPARCPCCRGSTRCIRTTPHGTAPARPH